MRPGMEPRMNRHHITTDARDGGMGLRQAWCTFITRWVTLGQNGTQKTGRTNQQLSATGNKYLDDVRALGSAAGQQISPPRIHRLPAEGLYDSDSSHEDPKLQTNRLHIATQRLSYDNVTQRDEPTLEETQGVLQALPLIQRIFLVTVYYIGRPTTTHRYTDGSKCHNRTGGGIGNGNLRAAFHVHGPQQVHRAETMACVVASHLAELRGDIIRDNQGVINATPVPRKTVVKDQD